MPFLACAFVIDSWTFANVYCGAQMSSDAVGLDRQGKGGPTRSDRGTGSGSADP